MLRIDSLGPPIYLLPDALLLLGNIGMPRRYPVTPGVKNQRLSVLILIFLNFAYKDHVIAAIVLPHFAANELGYDTLQNRYSRFSFDELDSGKLICEWCRELPG